VVTGGLGGGTNFLFSGASFGLNLTYAEEVVAHGVTQGLSRVAQGDKFEHGFLSGIFSGAFSPLKDLFKEDFFLHTVSAAIIGGTVSELGGGKFANGAGTAAFITGFTDIALAMRREVIRQSSLDKRNSSGISGGFLGDGKKTGGGRADDSGRSCDSLLGGCQGGQGKLFGIEYDPGSTADRLVEAYGGPHDFLNSWYWYNAQGNIDVSVYSRPFGEAFGTLLNVSDVFIATPLAVSSMVPSYAVDDFAFQLRNH
jgi:hypothetical protein